MKLEAKTVLLPREEREQLNVDRDLYGCAWILVTEGDIGQRIDPKRVKLEPAPASQQTVAGREK